MQIMLLLPITVLHHLAIATASLLSFRASIVAPVLPPQLIGISERDGLAAIHSFFASSSYTHQCHQSSGLTFAVVSCWRSSTSHGSGLPPWPRVHARSCFLPGASSPSQTWVSFLVCASRPVSFSGCETLTLGCLVMATLLVNESCTLQFLSDLELASTTLSFILSIG